jgi:hypothetical protein
VGRGGVFICRGLAHLFVPWVAVDAGGEALPMESKKN